MIMKKVLLLLTLLLSALSIYLFIQLNDGEENLKNCEIELEEMKFYLDDPFPYTESSLLKFDFCESKEAIAGNNRHNTITGVTYFTVPIPRGSQLNLVRKSKNKIQYVCTGKTYSNDVIYINKTELGMTRETSDSVEIEVVFRGFIEDKCNEGNIVDMFQEKKKGSVIQGVPLTNNKFVSE